jgi:hypothetical protein
MTRSTHVRGSMINRLLPLSALGFALCAAVPLAQAQTAPQDQPPGAAQNTPNVVQPNVPAPQPLDLAGAFASSVRAQAIYGQTQSDFNLTIMRLDKQFFASPAYRQAVSARDLAQADVERIRAGILADLSNDSVYRQDLDERDAVGKVLADQPNLAPRDRLELALAKLQYASQARQWENDAMNQSAELKAAQAKLINASRRVIDLQSQYDNNRYLDPSWQSAKRSLDTARLDMLTADAFLQGALQMRSDAIDAAYLNSQAPRVYNFPYSSVVGPYPISTSGVPY